MVEFMNKILVNVKQKGYGRQIAVQLQKMGIYAVVPEEAEESKIPYEEFRMILIDQADDDFYKMMIDEEGPQIVILTKSKDNYVAQRNGLYFISKELGIDSICSIIRFCMNGEERSNAVRQATTHSVRSMGIPVNLRGYQYLRTAIVCAVQYPELLEQITIKLYGRVADIHQVQRSSVERSIRNAIDVAHTRNPDLLRSYFHYSLEKPSNTELIALVADNIRMWIL